MSFSIKSLQDKKTHGEPIVMLTAYDFPMARIIDESGVDVILVGDSLGNVVLGYDNTIPVTMEDMIHHSKAVARGVKNALLVGDMPFMSYQSTVDQAVYNAGRFLREGGAHAVKLEGTACLPAIERMIEIGIPVMGHLGFTPQSIYAMGGPRVQGKTDESAKQLLKDAKTLEAVGVFALVLELIPDELAAQVTKSLKIPVIGIGAGKHCDGQVLVVNDLLGLTEGKTPKFVKRYAELGEAAKKAISEFSEDVRARRFPG